MFRFATPSAFLALLVPPLYAIFLRIWRNRRQHARSGVCAYPVSSFIPCRRLPQTWRTRFAPLPQVLFALAWCFLTIALARPQSGQEQHTDITQGIAIEMILDRSGSMRAPMAYRGNQLNRLDTVKEVFRQFVFGDRNSGLSGRHNDLIGIVAFSHYPYTFCPLTLDHDALDFSLKRIELITEEGDENGTAIGDAVAMGIARLTDAERTLSQQTRHDASTYRIKNKVIILLTDGQDEGPHTRSIREASELAVKYGIKVYTIAIIGTSSRMTIFGEMPIEYDTSDIQELARATGGEFNTCDTAGALLDIYKKIDALEKSSVESLRYVIHHELYVPFTVIGLLLLLAALLLDNTLFRRLT